MHFSTKLSLSICTVLVSYEQVVLEYSAERMLRQTPVQYSVARSLIADLMIPDFLMKKYGVLDMPPTPGAPSRQGCVASGQMAGKQQMSAPPPSSPPATALARPVEIKLSPHFGSTCRDQIASSFLVCLILDFGWLSYCASIVVVMPFF